MQSNLQNKLHIGLIMDGNGRWAQLKGLPRHLGHAAGVEALKRVVQASLKSDIGVLTVYAFSSDNWKRPKDEVDRLMFLMRHYLENEIQKLVENGIQLQVIGRRDRLPRHLTIAIAKAEQATLWCRALKLRIALDYSARDAIMNAALALLDTPDAKIDDFSNMLTGMSKNQDVDLIIRTSGEQRLSDFLLWESAYAELYFTYCLWPDFGPIELKAALDWYHNRDRRFGAISQTASTG